MKLKIEEIFANKEKEIANYKKYILNIEKYDSRIIYLSLCSNESMDNMRLMFSPSDFLVIKQQISNKVFPYFENVIKNYNKYWNLIDDKENPYLNYEIKDENKKTIMTINLENKKMEIILPPRINEYIEINIPYEENRFNTLQEEKNRLLSTLEEKSITKPSDYARKLIMPKRHDKQVMSKCEEIDILCDEIKNDIDVINQKCHTYFQTNEYLSYLYLKNKLEEFIFLKK